MTQKESETLEIGSRELSWLLDGLELNQPLAYGTENYSDIF